MSYKSRVKLHLQQRNNLYILKSGWLYRYVDLPDDRRQVLRVHYHDDSAIEIYSYLSSILKEHLNLIDSRYHFLHALLVFDLSSYRQVECQHLAQLLSTFSEYFP